MRRIGPYSRRGVLDKLDRRTAEARLIREVRTELTAHVGGTPSATQRAMIERIAWLRLHLRLMDNRTADGREMTEHDSRTYLAWTGSLSRLMRDLGPAVPLPAARPRSLQAIIAGSAAP